MKSMFLNRLLATVFVAAMTLALSSCKKNEDPTPSTAPVLTTVGATNITATSATVGGNITSNGGKDITEAGVVLSVLKPMPTTADEKKTSTTKSGAYAINLTGLASGTTYYVRAYAINEVGTTYGESVILATGNLAPEAKNVTLTGVASIDQKLTASYAYSDPENNAENGSTFKWYRANDAAGAGEVAIDGATKIDYTLTTADIGKFIRFGVTPKAATGTSTGTEVKSSFTVAISAQPNAAPTVAITSVAGLGAVDEKLTVAYTYSDGENDVESGTTFKWYVADNSSGLNETLLASETTATLLLKAAQLSKYVRVGITPKAGTGTQLGTEVKSAFTGPISAELTSVSFTYNANTVTYGIIKSSVTNKKWLDRNLGAPSVPTAYNDYVNYGDLFQWGRAADGHQLINRAATTAATTAVNGISTGLATSDNPGNNKFIQPSDLPGDWRDPQNNNLWQGESGKNNPCPTGWRLPTTDEWNAEQLGDNVAANFTQLKLTFGGKRQPDGSFSSTVSVGYYWSSTIAPSDPTQSEGFAQIDGDDSFRPTDYRAAGFAVRCIRN